MIGLDSLRHRSTSALEAMRIAEVIRCARTHPTIFSFVDPRSRKRKRYAFEVSRDARVVSGADKARLTVFRYPDIFKIRSVHAWTLETSFYAPL